MYGRVSGWPASAWSMIGRAMSIGMAKPMPLLFDGDRRVDADDVAAGVEQRAARVARVDGGVGLDEVRQRLVVVGRDRAALGRHDAARDRVRVRAERAADGDDELADLERVRVADRGGRQAGGVDLDDGEVGQRVDAVDRAGQDAAVLELDVELLAALDDVVVGEDPAVAVEDDAGADAGRAG